MNYQNNITSPNFGMAYKTIISKNLVKKINELPPEELQKLNAQMKDAAEKLKETKWSNVASYADGKGDIIHGVSFTYPKLDETSGKIVVQNGSAGNFLTLPKAVEVALERERSSAAMEKYLKVTEELLSKTRMLEEK